MALFGEKSPLKNYFFLPKKYCQIVTLVVSAWRQRYISYANIYMLAGTSQLCPGSLWISAARV